MLNRLTALIVPSPKTAEAWLARMGRPGVGARDQDAFLRWLEADPDHLRRYEQAKAAAAALEGLRGAFALDLLRSRRVEPRPERRYVLAGGLVAAGVAAAVVAMPMLRAPEARLYESAPGRISDVALGDGSHVTLDSGSAIRVSLGRDVRRVTLERGAAYFDVAHDSDHPFQVAVADRWVIVTGTRFVTALTGADARISLLQGRVLVATKDAGDREAKTGALSLSPGERAVFHPGQPGIEKAVADVETATAWRQRRLVFRDAPLSEVVAAASAYSAAPLVVADSALAHIRVTAVLPLEGEGALADRMAALLPVRTERTADGRVLIRAE